MIFYDVRAPSLLSLCTGFTRNEAVQNSEELSPNRRELKRFLGLCGLFSACIPNTLWKILDLTSVLFGYTQYLDRHLFVKQKATFAHFEFYEWVGSACVRRRGANSSPSANLLFGGGGAEIHRSATQDPSKQALSLPTHAFAGTRSLPDASSVGL